MLTQVDFVLLLDDDEASSFFHEIIVREAAITNNIIVTRKADDAKQFLFGEGKQLLKSRAIIFLDINMPAINGWEFLEEIRELGKDVLEKIDIIMLSASDYPKDIDHIRSHDMLKTFIPKMLTVEKIKKLFEQS